MLSLVDLFSGAGGFAEGFRRAGFRVLLGVDNDPAAIRSYKANFPEAIALAMDIKEVTGALIERLVGRPDVVIGSPPCEPYTGANPRRMKNPIDRLYQDPAGQLVLHFARIVGELKPKVFVMENVPGILDVKGELRRIFAEAGYPEVYFNILAAEDYGTPSHRLRVFISNIRIKPRKHPRRITVEEALRGLPEPGSSDVLNHELPPLSPRKARRIARLRWGQALIYYEGAEGRRYPNLIRLDPRRHAPTVLGSSRFIHPYEDRFLTVREQARLMGFPDNHVFLGGKDEQYNQVGEAVPVPLAEAIAWEVRRFLEKES
ncbi:DNA-cytosine modification methylase [Pyrodictium delaneyi]|uniref:DNA (cytosine-5-)-methyltransferase n=1 Tax=Pyrodictium delaneyi TaxID=1273541 RepID=A0A0P0N3M7_9CREN|nr:DNA cytosine methyltransferase [Pyrodictium delaneyi]ALL01264.1 DNA-cytosine modification methylase [Pyrodictium delaneyi]OWJ55663.1 DNA (cytosine-5-)-methyltransferase [Pyrodictium delaneyi]